MKNVYSDVIQFRGTHFAYGEFQGKQLLNTPLLSNRLEQWGPKKERHFIIDTKAFKEYINQLAPGILEEINGLASATNLDIQEAIRLFSGYYLEYQRSGCSVFTDPHYMIRNYDSHPRSYEGRYLLYQPTDGGYATIGPSMQVTGRIDGMNEKGLTMAYNFTHRKQSAARVVCDMVRRLSLERGADVEEATQRLNHSPHRHAFSCIVLDPCGACVVVEASPGNVIGRKSNGCTDHVHILHEEDRYG